MDGGDYYYYYYYLTGNYHLLVSSSNDLIWTSKDSSVIRKNSVEAGRNVGV